MKKILSILILLVFSFNSSSANNSLNSNILTTESELPCPFWDYIFIEGFGCDGWLPNCVPIQIDTQQCLYVISLGSPTVIVEA